MSEIVIPTFADNRWLAPVVSDEKLKAIYAYLFSDEVPEEIVAMLDARPVSRLFPNAFFNHTPMTKDSMAPHWRELTVPGRYGKYDFIMRPAAEATMKPEAYAELLSEKMRIHRGYSVQLHGLLAAQPVTGRTVLGGPVFAPHLDGGLRAGAVAEGVFGAIGGGGGVGPLEGQTYVVRGEPQLKDGVMIAAGGGGGGGQGGGMFFGGGMMGIGDRNLSVGHPAAGAFQISNSLLDDLIRRKAAEGEHGTKNILDSLIAVLGFAEVMAVLKKTRAALNTTVDDRPHDTPPEGATPTGATVQDDSDFAHIPEAEGEHMDIKGEIENWLDAGKASRAVTLCHWDNGILMKKTIFTEEGDAVTLLYAPNDKSANPEP